jgi:hypothetical protein
MADGFELYLVQSPDSVPNEYAENRGFNNNMLKYYKGSIPVTNLQDFIVRVISETITRKRLIRKLVIGSHGTGLLTGYGSFWIGKDEIGLDNMERIDALKPLSRLFTSDADVYIMACKTGRDSVLLREISRVLGGVRVHGFTDYIYTANYGLFVTLDDSTDDGGKEIVCLPSRCIDMTTADPKTGQHPEFYWLQVPGVQRVCR